MTEESWSANQQKAEPLPPTPAHGEGPGDAADAGGGGGAGDPQGVPVPSDEAAEGTSESAAPVDGVRTTAIAPEGLADGEPDNRMPPTSTF